ncbi:MAG: hypothetical protein V4585_04880 [Bacteroidota bacterium]|jgi:flagellar basal body-associated protein FliL
MEPVDEEMRSEIEDDKKTKPGNMFLLIVGIVVILMVIAVAGGFWSTKSVDGKHNFGPVTKKDTLVVTKSDTLKQ